MQKKLLILILVSVCLWACKQQLAPALADQPIPENIESTHEGKLLEDSLKKIYRQELYYAAPGTNVDSIRYENWKRNYALKQARRSEVGSRALSETFAGGLIQANWHERGPINEAGDMRVIDFDPATENLYAISTVGHLWKGNLNGTTWNVLNDDIRFETDEIEVVPHNGGQRIFAIYGTGTDNKKIRFSDDEGLNWTTGTGFQFYDHWGNGRRLYALSDHTTLYYLVHTWSGSPWGQLIQLYKSTDKGVSYSQVWSSPVGYSGEDVDLWKPEGSDEMFLVDNRAQLYFNIRHNFGNGSTTLGAPVSYSSQGIAVGGVHLSGRYNAGAGLYDLYLAHDSNKNIYKTTYGSPWTYLSTPSENVWVKGWLADPDNTNLYIGGFQLNKTSNGTTWQTQYPQWWRYYSHSKDSMHVDIMNLEYFKKSNGTPFIIILNHAGVHVTYDHFQTTANLGLNDLNVVTLYDQTTTSDGFLYCGAQDKGTFRYSGNSLANFNKLSTTNVTTGDGMLGVFFNSDQSYYTMLQNGGLQCVANRNTVNYTGFNIPGDHKPGWINPIVATPEFTDNKAYVAGGNLYGGAGSYLILADVDLSNGVSWQNTQYNYDFRAYSNNGTSVIKAIGVSNSDHDRIYVATQDATFFYSVDHGANWTKSTTAGLPSTLLPWDIKTSNTNADKVFISGTGFSNPGVYQSLDGGNTFTALNGSAPLATYFEVALSSDETMLFAATSNGPYVYVFAQSTWYPLLGATTPICDFNTVDNVGNNIIRFGTYGRGIWDFEMVSSPLPVQLASFSARPQGVNAVQLDWTSEQEQGVRDFVIEHSAHPHSFKAIGAVAAQGSSNTGRPYGFTHTQPEQGNNYYRLKIRDKNGFIAYSPIEVVRFETVASAFAVFPTVVQQQGSVYIQPMLADNYTFELYNLEGRLMLQDQAAGAGAFTANIPKGVYMYRVFAGQIQSTGRIVVQ